LPLLERRPAISTYKRLPRGKKKPKDEIADWSVHAVHFVRDNLKTVSWVVTVLLVAVIVYFGVGRVLSYRVNKAEKLLYAAELLASGSEVQQKALADIADDYGSTAAGREATMLLGDQLYARGDYQAALDRYEELAAKSGRAELMKIAAMHRAADAQRAMGKLDEAAKTYLAAAEDPKNLNRVDSYYQAGRCYEDLKQYDEAVKLYRKAMEISAESETRSQSEERLLWLMANGIITG
jgi:tetratricopeptide (TPR) repeat protein